MVECGGACGEWYHALPHQFTETRTGFVKTVHRLATQLVHSYNCFIFL